jgi:hypothetical protein
MARLLRFLSIRNREPIMEFPLKKYGINRREVLTSYIVCLYLLISKLDSETRKTAMLFI